VLLAEERDVVSMGKDQLEACLGKETPQVCSKHCLKETPHWNYMIRSLRPISEKVLNNVVVEIRWRKLPFTQT
jgi:hypothetical protein